MKKLNEISNQTVLKIAEDLKTESASDFLSFLTNIIAMVHDETDIDKKTNAHWVLVQIVDNVVQPWLRNDDKSAFDIANGLYEMRDIMGSERMKETLGVTMIVLGNELIESSMAEEYINDQITGLRLLHKIVNATIEIHYEKEAKAA